MKPDLDAFLKRTGTQPFEYGRNDCALWAAEWWSEVTGHDPARALRGTYRTRTQCFRIVARAGGMVSLCRRVMGRPEAIGDGIAVGRWEGHDLAGIVDGSVVIYRTEAGVIYDYRPNLRACWAF